MVSFTFRSLDGLPSGAYFSDEPIVVRRAHAKVVLLLALPVSLESSIQIHPLNTTALRSHSVQPLQLSRMIWSMTASVAFLFTALLFGLAASLSSISRSVVPLSEDDDAAALVWDRKVAAEEPAWPGVPLLLERPWSLLQQCIAAMQLLLLLLA